MQSSQSTLGTHITRRAGQSRPGRRSRARVPRRLRRRRRRRAVAENKISVEEVPDYYPADYADLIDDVEGGGRRARHLLEHLRGELGADLPRLQEEVPLGRERLRQRPRQRRGLPEDPLRAGDRRSSPVDLVVSNAASAWADFAERDGHADGLRVARARRAAGLRAAAAERLRDVDRPDDDRLQHRADGEAPDGHRRAWPTSPRRTRTSTRTRSPSVTRRARSASPSPTPSPRPTRGLGRPRAAAAVHPRRDLVGHPDGEDPRR